MLGLLFFGQFLGSLSPYVFGKSVDAVLAADARHTVLFLLAAFAMTLVQTNVLSWVREYFEITKLDDNLDQYLTNETLKKMLAFSVGQHINEHSGIRQSIVNRGQNALTEYMKNMLYGVIPKLLSVFLTLGILAYVEWRIAALASVFIVAYFWVSIRRNKRYFSRLDTMRKQRQGMGKLQNEFFRNATLVIAEGREAEVVEEYGKKGGEFLSLASRTWRDYIRSFYSQRPIILVGQFVSLGLGTYFIFTGDLPTGMFVTLTSWISSMIFGNLIEIMSMQRRMLALEIEIKKLYDLLDIAPDVDPNVGGATVESFQGKIEFQDVSFAYPYRHARSDKPEEDDEMQAGDQLEESQAVSNVNLVIPAGSKVGFVGVSGSGKSTIVNLMRRYYDPSKGVILIDGVPLAEMDLHWFRQKIGNVEQKIELLDRSIRENILFGLAPGTSVSEDDLQKAVRDASLEDFIAKLAEGLDTIIGENGVKVSGGERQRIGIARALIKNPKILIFDEATSALDSINEKLIHEAIERGAKGRTTIMIAHRLSTITDADIIFVVANGVIVASGTHEELQKKSKEYQELIKHQVLAV